MCHHVDEAFSIARHRAETAEERVEDEIEPTADPDAAAESDATTEPDAPTAPADD